MQTPRKIPNNGFTENTPVETQAVKLEKVGVTKTLVLPAALQTLVRPVMFCPVGMTKINVENGSKHKDERAGNNDVQ